MKGLIKMACMLICVLAMPAMAGTQAIQRDGNHDFDFNFGTWQTRIRILKDPLSGSHKWVKLSGTVAVSKIWDGKAQIEQIEAAGTDQHFEGLTLFLYDTKARQWTMSYASSRSGVLENPMTGSFENGQGVFYGQDTYKGRLVLVRFIWSRISPASHHVEQSFSADGGKTWEPNFVADLTRTTQSPQVAPVDSEPGQHAFDWQLGQWTIHMHRMLHPLSTEESWTTYDGTVDVSRLWNGRANLAEIETSGPAGHLQFLSLRLYNPSTHQWTLNFAHAGSDTVSAPMYGEFKDGRGEFYDMEKNGGRTLLARFVFDSITSTKGRDEQAFSTDGGKTWEINWINVSTRIPDRVAKKVSAKSG